ncbi:VOC family protein [Naasia lichenicola]|uniref:VOC family protein n=1 Tax=Naasia lichenicola TaxID=2565933 RepID=A0A4S4FN21_9MICO|nr:VOC family protein [Naasia lichenicola]THG30636.1 VOC family protein [Naasia lichenicola]THG31873.1 VOC family protein [Naasia lichenicola]
MKVTGVTVSIGVQDLKEAVEWYRRALAIEDPAIEPAPGVVELDLGGGSWLQFIAVPALPEEGRVTPYFTIEDVAGEHGRMSALGLTVTPLTEVEGVVAYFDLTDLHGTQIGFVTVFD